MALLPAFKDLELDPETYKVTADTEPNNQQNAPHTIAQRINADAITAITEKETPNIHSIKILGHAHNQLNTALIQELSVINLPLLVGFCPNYINLIYELIGKEKLLEIIQSQKPSTAIRLSLLEKDKIQKTMEETSIDNIDAHKFLELLKETHTKIEAEFTTRFNNNTQEYLIDNLPAFIRAFQAADWKLCNVRKID